MSRVWIHFSGIFLLLVLTGGGIYTNAFFYDAEKGDPNMLSATDLDGELAGLGISDSICLISEETETQLDVSNSGSLPYTYDLVTENTTGTACGALEIQAFRNGDLEYTGSIADLSLSGFVLDAVETDSWRVKVKFPFETIGSCTFDTVMRANQSEFLSGQAYFDTERITHTVGVTTGSECGPSVDLHLTKAISGDSNGFALSDFSYRVTGPEIDTIVPHGGTVALPEGVYTIEELVPEGFVKEDWRIGWYGQCDSGSDFSTTILIDEGNVDHGTLYCQADNQYRPELTGDQDEIGDSLDSTAPAPRRTTRESRTDRLTRNGSSSESVASSSESVASSSESEDTPEESVEMTTGTTTAEGAGEGNEAEVAEDDVTSEGEQDGGSEPVAEEPALEESEEVSDKSEPVSEPEPEPEPEPKPEPEPASESATEEEADASVE